MFIEWCSNNKDYTYIEFIICGPLDSVSSILWDLHIFCSFIWDLNIRRFLGKTVVNYIKSDKLMCVCVCVCVYAQSFPTLCDPMDHMDCSLLGYSVHGDSLGQNTGVGCHFILQRIFPTQESRIAGRFFTI